MSFSLHIIHTEYVMIMIHGRKSANAITLYESRNKKTGLRGFRPGLTQTEMYSH